MNLAIVIPALNEQATVADVVASALPFGQVIVVDDGSQDDTGSRASQAGADVVRLERNLGYDGAISAGFRRADEMGMDAVVTFDADGEHRLQSLAEVCHLMQNAEVDLVIGVRDQFPRFSETIFNGYSRLRYGVPDLLCGLKGYRLALYREHGSFSTFKSIGTQLALWALSRKKAYHLVKVTTSKRLDTPRLGAFFRGNFVILRALAWTLLRDLRRVP